MNINLNEVREHVELYFKENLPMTNTQYWRSGENPATPMTAISLWYQQKMITALMPFGLAGMNSTRASITVTTI